MTPTETLTAAIDKLTRLRDESTPGPWEHHRDSEQDLGFGPVMESLITVEDGCVLDWGSGVREADAELIVTLHATIDAQLAILEDTLRAFTDPDPIFGKYTEAVVYHQIRLAESILGGAS